MHGDADLLRLMSAADRSALGLQEVGDPAGISMTSVHGGGFKNTGGSSCFVNAPLQLFLRLEPVAEALRQAAVVSGASTQGGSSLADVLATQAQGLRSGSRCDAQRVLEEVTAGRLGKLPSKKVGVSDEVRGGDAVAVLLGSSASKGEQMGLVDALGDGMPVPTQVQRGAAKRARGSSSQDAGLLRRALFGGVVREREYCSRCRKATDVLRECHRIDLKCTGSDSSSNALQQLLDMWGTAPASSGRCSRGGCPGRTEAVRYLEKEPPVLVLVINRRENSSKHKCSRPVIFPEALEYPVVRSGRYALAGVLQHRGEKDHQRELAARGHFVATCAVGSDGYVVCDDETVTRKTWGEVAGPDLWRSAHVLVYSRQTTRAGTCEGMAKTPYVKDSMSAEVVGRFVREEARVRAARLPLGQGHGRHREVGLPGGPVGEGETAGVGRADADPETPRKRSVSCKTPSAQAERGVKRPDADADVGVGSHEPGTDKVRRRLEHGHIVSAEAASAGDEAASVKFPSFWGSEQARHAARDKSARAAEARAEAGRWRGVGDLRASRRASSALALRALQALQLGQQAAVERTERVRALRDRFGAQRVAAYLAEVEGGAAAVDLDVLAEVLAADQARELDVAVQEEVDRRRGGHAGARRWQDLMEAMPPQLREGLLLALHGIYGSSCRRILAEEWSCAWAGWDARQPDGSMRPSDGQGLLQILQMYDLTQEEVLFGEDLLDAVFQIVRRHMRAAGAHRADLHMTDAEMRAKLCREGLHVGLGKIWNSNNCLSDSLLQLLREAGFVDASVDADARKEACLELRRRLVDLPEDSPLRPRCRDPMLNTDLGLDNEAFLQPDVHGQFILEFFMEHFHRKGLARGALPSTGVKIEVRSRFDSETIVPAYNVVCRGTDSRPGAKPMEFLLYNTTNEGISGTHFDPIFRSPAVASGGSPERRVRRRTLLRVHETAASSASGAVDVVDISDEEPAAGSSSMASSSATSTSTGSSASAPVASGSGDTSCALRRSARVAARSRPDVGASGRVRASGSKLQAQAKRPA